MFSFRGVVPSVAGAVVRGLHDAKLMTFDEAQRDGVELSVASGLISGLSDASKSGSSSALATEVLNVLRGRPGALARDRDAEVSAIVERELKRFAPVTAQQDAKIRAKLGDTQEGTAAWGLEYGRLVDVKFGL